MKKTEIYKTSDTISTSNVTVQGIIMVRCFWALRYVIFKK